MDKQNATASDPNAEPKLSFGRKLWVEWIKPFLLIAIVLAPLRSAVADWNDVPTGSMKPTILEGDRVVVNKLAYDLKIPFTRIHLAEWNEPKRGDVVVFFSPADGKRLVKRVVGQPGDEIELRDNVLYVNSQRASYQPVDGDDDRFSGMHESFPYMLVEETVGERTHPIMVTPYSPALRNFGPTTVPPGYYFMMGDNRDNSYDSRYFGFIERDRIVGKAVAVAFSLDHNNYLLPRENRFFRSLR